MIHFHYKSAVQPTICEVRGVERQPAAKVLINPPAGFEEIFTLWTEKGRGEILLQQGHSPVNCSSSSSRRVQVRMDVSVRHLQVRKVTAAAP